MKMDEIKVLIRNIKQCVTFFKTGFTIFEKTIIFASMLNPFAVNKFFR
jgi:hypothetical protein